MTSTSSGESGSARIFAINFLGEGWRSMRINRKDELVVIAFSVNERDEQSRPVPCLVILQDSCVRLYRNRVRVAFCESFKTFVSQPPLAGVPAFLISS